MGLERERESLLPVARSWAVGSVPERSSRPEGASLTVRLLEAGGAEANSRSTLVPRAVPKVAAGVDDVAAVWAVIVIATLLVVVFFAAASFWEASPSETPMEIISTRPRLADC